MATGQKLTSLTRLAARWKRSGQPLKAVQILDRAVCVAAAQLADIHGQRGGALRAAGQWGAAISEFDTGHALEVRYATGQSYNALNRLVCRIARPVPGASEPRWPTLDIKIELAALQAGLLQRIEQADPLASIWDLGDLALVAALRGDLDAIEHAVDALQALNPATHVADAYIATLDLLAREGCEQTVGLQALRHALRP
jgi:hypothetical protein